MPDVKQVTRLFRFAGQLWCAYCLAPVVEAVPLPEELTRADEESCRKLLEYLDELYPPVEVAYWRKCDRCGFAAGNPDGEVFEPLARN